MRPWFIPLLLSASAPFVAAQVDLPLSPASQERFVGEVGDVELRIEAGAAEQVVSVEAILTWDATRLSLQGFTIGDLPHLEAGFLNDPDDINDDTDDGDALFTLLAPLGDPIDVPPDGLVATFHFEVLATGGAVGGTVSMPASLGAFGQSRVLGPVPGQEITGALSTPVEIVVPAFGPGVDVGVGSGPCDVVIADLDGDGAPDIATADSGSDTVTILPGVGDGTFPTAVTVSLAPGDVPAALAAGELVGAPGLDLAVALSGGDGIALVDGATQSVSAVIPTLPSTEPVGIDVGDLDGAGPDDVVVALQGDLLLSGTSGVAVSLNGAPPTLLPPPVGGFLRPQNVALGDLDGDGDLDVVAVMSGTPSSPSVTDNVLLYEHLGGGVFVAPVTLSVPQNPRGLCIRDLDGDGDADLVVTSESFPSTLPGTIEVFVNDGLVAGAWSAGDVSSGGSFTGGVAPRDVACADLRDDSIPGDCPLEDVVVVNFGSEDVTWFEGYDVSVPWFPQTHTTTTAAVPYAVALGDLDGDKTPDTVVANKGAGSVTVLLDVARAQAKTFGVGCPGTNGVPQIAPVGLPTYSNPAFGVALSSARTFAPTLLGLSLYPATTDLGGGCLLYLQAPLVLTPLVTDGTGDALVTLAIPGAASPVAGCEVFFQYFVFDDLGAYAGSFAFSDALRIKVGQ